MPADTDVPPPDAEALEPGLRAARLRRGYTQEQVATLVNTSLSSYRKWDRGGRPADPRKAQALVEVLETPMEILWPPESNPAVASALHAVRQQRAHEQAEARDKQRHLEIESGLHEAPNGDARVWAEERVPAAAASPTEEGPARRRVPSALDLVATLDGKDDVAPGTTPPVRRRRRLLIPAAVSTLAIVAAGTAIATTGDDTTPRAASVAHGGPSAAERERGAQRIALARAQERGDYDRAITIAARLDDPTAATQLRQTAGGLLARRARTAAERGDLPLATSRLDKAEKRYGELPAINTVRQRIEAIQDARKERAAARKRAAKKRAAARARAAARRQTPSSPVTPPSSSAAPSTPAPSSPAPSTPAPSSPKPKTGGGSGSSGGSSSGETADPGIY